MKDELTAELDQKGIAVSLEEGDKIFKGRGVYQGKPCFVKVAKTDKQRTALIHSIQFAEAIFQQNPPFVVPEVFTSGDTNQGLFYKVDSLVDGEPFATLSEGVSILSIEDPQAHFPTIAKALIWLSQTKVHLLITSYDQRLRASERSLQDEMLRAMIKWSETTTPHLVSLLKIVLNNKNAFKRTVAHGDITPINTVVNDQTNEVAFVDMDLATQKAPEYYDLVEFGNRFWTRVGRPDLAKMFWTEALQHLDEQQKQIFLQQLLVVGAFRAVGNFYEISKLSTSDQVDKRRKWATDFVNFIVNRRFREIF